MIYGYARVSTKGQARDGTSLIAQKEALITAGANKIFEDEFTGTTTDRPEFNKLLKIIENGDTLIVTKLDRIARSASQGLELIDELNKKNIKINILNIGIIDNSSIGKLLRTVMFAFAEFEKDLILERTREGKEKAKNKQGFKEGRPIKYSLDQIKHALNLLKEYSFTVVEKKTGISKSSLVRYKKKFSVND